MLSLVCVWLGATACVASAESPGETRLNVLLVTVDDMSQDSVGVYGCRVPEITPRIDQLAREGMRFEHAHVTIAVCQPCRAVWMTGRYPHRNGALGFDEINEGVPTLPETLKDAGYYVACLGKTTHVIPSRADVWDHTATMAQLGQGRRPDRYAQEVGEVIEEARAESRPFFCMVNIHDPHRPFAIVDRRDDDGKGLRRMQQPIPHRITTDEVDMPEFLPDLPDVRQELAYYFTSVARADASLGAVLDELDKQGANETTLVMFLSDHGMPLPFAKTNCYFQSTRTPWIVRWPGKVEAGKWDDHHMISGIDLAPTLLDALDIEPMEGMDGRSFLPVLQGESQEGRDFVMTQFHRTFGKGDYSMRSLVTRTDGYIWNPWSDGKTVFRNESQSGLTMAAMNLAAETDAEIRQRVELFLKRVPQEYYRYAEDPDALHNLIDCSECYPRMSEVRQRLLEEMRHVDDPLADDLAKVIEASSKDDSTE